MNENGIRFVQKIYAFIDGAFQKSVSVCRPIHAKILRHIKFIYKWMWLLFYLTSQTEIENLMDEDWFTSFIIIY